MIQTAEKIIESVISLPKPEREKFFSWAENEIHKKSSGNNAKEIKLEAEQERFRRSLKWIEEHKEEFDGQWVALDGDTLLAHGSDGKKVHAEAQAKGVLTPLMERIKAKDLPFGGW
ncbi:MAG: DUF5678 domain-containing protein [Pyrinomonadaceae bacterium]|nr:DUF5678 domain-containing protein [Pyrinomonadaceae bacterium]